jgi:hypothetical protein
MSYFEPKKTTSAGKSFLEGQRSWWRDLVGSAEVVAIVGVKVRPRDDHIWDPITNAPGRIVYCAGSSATSEFKSWAASTRPSKSDLVLSGYFADSLETICREVGLI